MLEGLIILLIFIFALCSGKIEYNEDFLSKEQGNCIKGIAALLLVIVHIRERLSVVPIAYKMLASGGYLLVAIFFFYSGYGITLQSKRKEGYIQKRMPRRILYLIKLMIVCEFIYYITDIFLFDRPFDVVDAIACIGGIYLINGALWTIIAMIIIEIMLYVFLKVDSKLIIYKKFKIWQWALGAVLIYMMYCVARGRSVWEMQSCIAFVFGAYVAENESVKQYVKESELRRFFFISMCFCITFIAPYILEKLIGKDYSVIRVLFGSMSSCLFVIAILNILKQWKFHNPLLIYIGNLFTEIYLWHGLVIRIIKYIFPTWFCGENYVAMSIAILVIVITVASCIEQANIFITKKYTNRICLK